MTSFQDFWHLQTLEDSFANGEPFDVLLEDALSLLLGLCVLVRLMKLPLSSLSAWENTRKTITLKLTLQISPASSAPSISFPLPHSSPAGLAAHSYLSLKKHTTISDIPLHFSKIRTSLPQFLGRFWCFFCAHLIHLQTITFPFSFSQLLFLLNPGKHSFDDSSTEPGPAGEGRQLNVELQTTKNWPSEINEPSQQSSATRLVGLRYEREIRLWFVSSYVDAFLLK